MIDTAVLWVRAEANIRAGRYADALVHLRHLIEVVDRIDFEYEEWLRAMVECLRTLALWREGAACSAYLGATEVPAAGVLERAQVGDAQAQRGIRLMGVYLSRAGEHVAAAEWFRVSGMLVHRAIELERAGMRRPGSNATDLADLSRPALDWVSLARGFGVPGTRVTTAGELDAALARSLETAGPYLIEAVF